MLGDLVAFSGGKRSYPWASLGQILARIVLLDREPFNAQVNRGNGQYSPTLKLMEEMGSNGAESNGERD